MELFIKNPKTITVILSGHKSLKTGPFIFLSSKLKFLLSAQLAIGLINVCPYR